MASADAMPALLAAAGPAVRLITNGGGGTRIGFALVPLRASALLCIM